MRGSREVATLFVLALVAGGCGSGGNQADVSPVVAAATPQTATPATPTTSAAEVAKAQAAVLQTTDFPPGFQPQADAPGEGLGIEQLWGELTACLGVSNTAKGTAAATSPTFLRGLATQARATVEYAPEPAAAALAAAMGGQKFQACAKETFGADVKRSAPQGAVPGPVAIAPLAAPPVGAKTFTYRVNVTLDLEGLKVPLFNDFIVVLERGAVIRMLFLNPGSEFPQDLERSLVEKVVARV
ncbi:MAG TPA: hypothetical protein VMZ73_08555 [Acidimicrobiales bacterium]|nr:hypothetical protein [Acidimicrobiales bacterium]